MTAAAVPSPPTLLPHHQAMLTASAISRPVQQTRGWYSESDPKALRRLGLVGAQATVGAGLVVPIYDIEGRLALHQFRADNPRLNKDGKEVKYDTPKGARICLDVHPLTRELVKEELLPLLVTEGSKKVDAAISAGHGATIGVLGVWNFQRDGEPLPDWEHIPLNGRTVYICFDSDAMRKIEVRQALRELRCFLLERGAEVLVITLPDLPGKKKTGLDDFLAAGKTLDDLFDLATSTLKPLPGEYLSEVQRALVTQAGRRLKGLADVTASGLFIAPNLTEESKKRLCLRLSGILSEQDDIADWWKGDLYLAFKAEIPHGSQTDKLKELLGPLYWRAQKVAWLVKLIPPERRREGVPISIWEVLQRVSEEEQEALLDEYQERRFSKNRLTRAELRRRLDLPEEETAQENRDHEGRAGQAPPSLAARLYQALPRALLLSLLDVVEQRGTEGLEAWVEAEKAAMEAASNFAPAQKMEDVDAADQRWYDDQAGLLEEDRDGEKLAPAPAPDNPLQPFAVVSDRESVPLYMECEKSPEETSNFAPVQKMDPAEEPPVLCLVSSEPIAAPPGPAMVHQVPDLPPDREELRADDGSPPDLRPLIAALQQGDLHEDGCSLVNGLYVDNFAGYVRRRLDWLQEAIRIEDTEALSLWRQELAVCLRTWERRAAMAGGP